MANPSEEGLVNNIIDLIASGRIVLASDEIKKNTKGLILNRNRVLSFSTAEILMSFLRNVVKGKGEKCKFILSSNKTKKQLTQAQIARLLQLVANPIVVISNMSNKRQFLPNEPIKLRAVISGLDVKECRYTWNFFEGMYNENSTLIGSTSQKAPQNNDFIENIRFSLPSRYGQFSIKFELIYPKPDGMIGNIPSFNFLVIEIVQPGAQPQQKPKAQKKESKRKEKEATLEGFIDELNSAYSDIIRVLYDIEHKFWEKRSFLTNERARGFLDKLWEIEQTEQAYWWERLKEIRDEGNPLKKARDLDMQLIERFNILKQFELQLLGILDNLSKALAVRNVSMPEISELEEIIRKKANGISLADDEYQTGILHLITIAMHVDRAEEIREEHLIQLVEEGHIDYIVQDRFVTIRNDESKLMFHIDVEKKVIEEFDYYIKKRQHYLIGRIILKIKIIEKQLMDFISSYAADQPEDKLRAALEYVENLKNDLESIKQSFPKFLASSKEAEKHEKTIIQLKIEIEQALAIVNTVDVDTIAEHMSKNDNSIFPTLWFQVLHGGYARFLPFVDELVTEIAQKSKEIEKFIEKLYRIQSRRRFLRRAGLLAGGVALSGAAGIVAISKVAGSKRREIEITAVFPLPEDPSKIRIDYTLTDTITPDHGYEIEYWLKPIIEGGYTLLASAKNVKPNQKYYRVSDRKRYSGGKYSLLIVGKINGKAVTSSEETVIELK